MIIQYLESEKKFYMNKTSMNEFQVRAWLDKRDTIIQYVTDKTKEYVSSELIHIDFNNKNITSKISFSDYLVEKELIKLSTLKDAFIVDNFDELVRDYPCQIENKQVQGKKTLITRLKLVASLE